MLDALLVTSPATGIIHQLSSRGFFLMGAVSIGWTLSQRTTDLKRLDLRKLHTPTGRRQLLRQLLRGILVGLVHVLVHAFAVAVVVLVFVYAVGIGLVFGLVAGLENRPDAIDKPRRLVTEGITHTTTLLVSGLVSGLVLVPVVGFLAGHEAEHKGDYQAGLLLGLTFGFTIALLLVSKSPWPRYLLTCALLAPAAVRHHSSWRCSWTGL